MNTGVGPALIGHWYRHLDKGEIFQIIGLDIGTKSIVTQSFDGDIDEFSEEDWITLPVGLAEPPEDWTGPIDAVDVNDLGYSETDMAATDWDEPLQPLVAASEAWEDSSDEERDPEGEGLPVEDFVLDNPDAIQMLD